MNDPIRKPHPGAQSREITDGSVEHDHDDFVGRLLSRREMMRILGGTGAALAAGGSLAAFAQSTRTPTPTATAAAAGTAEAMPTCVAVPDLTEGPYFTDIRLDRSDIRLDPTTGEMSEGVLMRLNFNVTQVDGQTCTPFPDVMVDVWHCDAAGVYSNFQGDDGTSAVGQYFLRGYQMTDENGRAEFITIYPGWYQGRTVHIHFKMRTDADSTSGYEFTSQLFFDDAVSDQVFKQPPYNEKTGSHLLNSEDRIFGQSGGQLMVALTEDSDGGYTATFNIGLDLTATPQNANAGGMGGPGRGTRPAGPPPAGTRPATPGG